MKSKRIILITILFLTIGFAAVSTTLIININSIIGTNHEDFDVYFSSAIVDTEDVSDKVISEDKLSINYKTKDLSQIGDTSILEYEVTNVSKNYDANVEVTCTGDGELVIITQTPNNQIIKAAEISTGTIKVTLNKNVVDEQTIEFVCTLNVNAIERTVLGENFKACDYEIGTEWTYDYTGTEQEFIVPCDGTYKLEVWGAQGGYALSNSYPGGYGAYSNGIMDFNEFENLYIYVGGKGIDGTTTTDRRQFSGGYNGGGAAFVYGNKYVGSGGGATHIAKVEGLLSELEIYKGTLNLSNTTYESQEIIIVSGGGGGSSYEMSRYYALGGAGGGVKGNNSTFSGYTERNAGYGGTQLSAGSTNQYYIKGGFGFGASTDNDGNGAGSGFFGGGISNGATGGGGGSSYIGNPMLTDKAMYCYNCETSELEETKTISTTNVSENPISEYAKQGNGYAKITLIALN